MIDLPLPPKLLSPNVRAHWGAKARATKTYRAACALIAKQALPKGWRPCRVEIDVEYRCSKGADGYVVFDVGNAAASIKAGIDGLIDAGVAPSDSKVWLTWGDMTLITRRNPLGDGVTITVRANP